MNEYMRDLFALWGVAALVGLAIAGWLFWTATERHDQDEPDNVFDIEGYRRRDRR